MTFQETPTKIRRFDFDDQYANLTKLEYREKIVARHEFGKTDKDETWIGVRWTINFLDKKTGQEILGLLSEKRAVVIPDDKDKDYGHLKQWTYNSFMNVEMHYQDNAPSRYRHISFSQPDTDSVAKELYDILEQDGFWK